MDRNDLTDEELDLVRKFREEKSLSERKRSLEEEFQKEFSLIGRDINLKLEEAKTALNEAISLSEKHGIPFKSSITDLSVDRQYLPQSFNKKWGSAGIRLREFEIYCDDIGWEYWNTSSLSC